MHATILRMISSNSLTAFSAATTTNSVQKPQQLRLVREQVSQTGASGTAAKIAIPSERPSTALPRGSLLNLSV